MKLVMVWWLKSGMVLQLLEDPPVFISWDDCSFGLVQFRLARIVLLKAVLAHCMLIVSSLYGHC
jgi:hypothetical protein